MLAVRELDRRRAMRLIEAARALVLLEDPELEAVRPQRRDVLEQRVADADPDLVRMDVEMRQPVAVENRETATQDVRLRVADATAEEAEVLLVSVELRQEVEQRKRRLEDRDDLLDVVWGRAPDHAP